LFTTIYSLNTLELFKRNYTNTKCVIPDLGEYFDYLNKYTNFEDQGYKPIDCIKDACKFYNVTCPKEPMLNHSLYNDPENKYQNCYCYPMYCIDENTINIPTEFQNTYSIFESPLGAYNATITFPNICKIKLYNKSNNTDENFLLLKFTGKTLYSIIDNIMVFTMFLTETKFLDGLYRTNQLTLQVFNLYVIIIFSILLLVVGILMVKFLSMKSQKVCNRLEEMKDIHNIAIHTEGKNDDDDNNNDIMNDQVDKVKDGTNINVADGKINSPNNFNKNEENVILTSGDKHKIKSNKNKNDKSNQEIDNKRTNGSESDDKNNELEVNQINMDELDDIKYLVNENINLFNIDFNISQNLHENDPLVVSFIKEVKMKRYLNQLLPQSILDLNERDKDDDKEPEQEIQRDSVLENDTEGLSKENVVVKTEDSDMDLNSLILYELLSTELIDFDDYKQNFFYKEQKNQHLFNFYSEIEKLLLDDESEIGEVTNHEKINKFMGYYKLNIHKPWMLKYDKNKQKPDI